MPDLFFGEMGMGMNVPGGGVGGKAVEENGHVSEHTCIDNSQFTTTPACSL